jgi:hypothetical protein
METTFSFGIISSFIGASFSIERNCGNWWKSYIGNRLIKCFIVTVSGFLYLYLFSNSQLIRFDQLKILRIQLHIIYIEVFIVLCNIYGSYTSFI